MMEDIFKEVLLNKNKITWEVLSLIYDIDHTKVEVSDDVVKTINDLIGG
jgi:hypothetical protein